MTPEKIASQTADTKSLGVWFPTLQAGTGADRFTERLVDALNKRGIRAEISWLPKRAEYLPWSVKIPQSPTWANVVHINPWLPKRFVPRHLPCVATLHSCVHDTALLPYKTVPQILYHRLWMHSRERSNLSCSQAVTAVSKYTSIQSERSFQISGIQPIANWINTDTFSPGSNPEAHEPFRLLFVGNINLRKGADLLPDIMSQLGGSFELRFTGTKKQLREFGRLPENLVPLGRLTSTQQLVSAYRQSDALLLPTRMEGLPLVALEAMACGLPIIGTDATSLPELVVSGESGLLCPQDDKAGFAAAVRRLREDPKAAKKMGARARELALAKFSENEAVGKYIKLYRALLQ